MIKQAHKWIGRNIHLINMPMYHKFNTFLQPNYESVNNHIFAAKTPLPFIVW